MNFYAVYKCRHRDSAVDLDHTTSRTFLKYASGEEGLVKNVMTISDFGNFVISPELLTEIQGFRSNFSDFLKPFSFKET